MLFEVVEIAVWKIAVFGDAVFCCYNRREYRVAVAIIGTVPFVEPFFLAVETVVGLIELGQHYLYF